MSTSKTGKGIAEEQKIIHGVRLGREKLVIQTLKMQRLQSVCEDKIAVECFLSVQRTLGSVLIPQKKRREDILQTERKYLEPRI